MKMLIVSALPVALWLAPQVVLAVPANASRIHASPTACSNLLRECVANEGAARGNCFHDAASDERCKGTELGKLSFMRWTSTARASGDGMALLGPQFVDRECVTNFDNQLSSELIRGTPGNDNVQGLISRLQACHKDAAEDVYRP